MEMQKPLYSISQFMALTHVTKKTLRYYDEHDILRPSFVNEHGARFYSQEDLLKMQQILLLKYLGFSLADIREMTITADSKFMENSLHIQKKLIEDKIEQLQIVSRALDETSAALKRKEQIDWSDMLNLIQDMNMEQSLMTQYQNASNISSRIQLHALYSENKQGWFSWLYEQSPIKAGFRVLELGCGDGKFWTENRRKLPEKLSITLSDISQGMLRDARRSIGPDSRFRYLHFGCEEIQAEDQSFDMVLANHVLFYAEDVDQACREIRRVLKPGGILLASTYGNQHMQEISRLAAKFDDRIILSAEKLFLHFGKENGAAFLSPYFSCVQWRQYEDRLFVTDPAALISYILSCHGNQTQYILDRYSEFRHFVAKATEKGFSITKDAGVFICRKSLSS